jgi:ribosome-binding factor A
VRQFKRSSRLSGQILKDIAKLLQTELAEKLPGLVTFTNVRMSDDLRYATVYYSFLGEESQRDFVAGYLLRERKRIRHQIGTNLHIRHIPELTFKFDPSVEEGLRIEKLLNDIQQSSKEDRDEPED